MKIEKGSKLAALLNASIENKITEAKSRADIVAGMASAAGISSSTVNQILNGTIDIPPLNRLEGFARALGISTSRVRSAAEADGGNFSKLDIEITGKIEKLDEEQQLVFGWASVSVKNGSLIKDSHDDIIKENELEKASYDFVLKSRKAGEMHQTTEGIGDLVESIFFSVEKQKALGLADTPLPIGWWVGFKVNKEIFEKVKTGKYSMFSIGGKGNRTKI